jgi:hypothetical protein
MICQSPRRRFLRTAAVIRSTIGLIVELSASPRRPWGLTPWTFARMRNKQTSKKWYFSAKNLFSNSCGGKMTRHP